MIAVRYGLPVLLLLAGIVFLLVGPSGARVEAWAMFTGAGLAVLLLNVLYRVGVSGDVERAREEEARSHFEETGEWPEEEERPAGRKWRLPEGIATPEPEAAERERQR
ncbi:MAG TPA: hypothetical protein VKB17_08825 [Thermoleophilaceae bacterium]|nr:hypothetical protein [Thermoleophilaceae bacterium]